MGADTPRLLRAAERPWDHFGACAPSLRSPETRFDGNGGGRRKAESSAGDTFASWDVSCRNPMASTVGRQTDRQTDSFFAIGTLRSYVGAMHSSDEPVQLSSKGCIPRSIPRGSRRDTLDHHRDQSIAIADLGLSTGGLAPGISNVNRPLRSSSINTDRSRGVASHQLGIVL